MKSLGQSRSHLLSKLHVKILAKARSNGDPIPARPTCLKYFLLDVKRILKKITTIMFRGIGGILVVIIQVVNTNTDGLV